jgi:hypothetical protein
MLCQTCFGGLLLVPLGGALALLPLLGMMLNGTSSVLHGACRIAPREPGHAPHPPTLRKPASGLTAATIRLCSLSSSASIVPMDSLRNAYAVPVFTSQEPPGSASRSKCGVIRKMV